LFFGIKDKKVELKEPKNLPDLWDSRATFKRSNFLFYNLLLKKVVHLPRNRFSEEINDFQNLCYWETWSLPKEVSEELLPCFIYFIKGGSHMSI